MWIDSHCHLNNNRLRSQKGEPGAIVAAARAAGVDGMLTICCRIREELDELTGIARENTNVWCTIGTHPHDAGQPAEKSVTLDELVKLSQSDQRIVGIGESGLDYFYKHSSPEDQQESFRKHIRACIQTGLPLVVHARDADEDIMRIIREEGAGTSLTGVMHCFSSGRAMGEDALDFGFYISFSGIVTFKKSTELQDFARAVPADRLLVETDSPYLAPEPHRGATNEPALVVHTGEMLAALRGVGTPEMARQTTENFFRLFPGARG
jgi:TatD DNase family protein